MNYTFKSVFVLLAFLLVGHSISFAQSSNNWINFDQTYYKIPVIQDGVYQVTKADLESVGMGTINPKHIQLYHRGVEQAIYVEGEDDNSLDTGDFVEFYAKRNDGTLDASLYAVSTRQVNKYYNLYSDTTAYFLTWTLDGILGKRMEEIDEPYIDTPLPYHWKEELIVYSNEYSTGQNYPIPSNEEIYRSEFDNGEGWVSTLINTGQSRNITIPIHQLYNPNNNNIEPVLEIVLVGAKKNVNQYKVDIKVGKDLNNLRLLSSIANTNFQKAVFTTSHHPKLEFSDIGETGQLIVQLNCTQGGIRIAYIKVTYPQILDLEQASSTKIGIPSNNNAISYLNVSNPPIDAKVLDITKLDAIRRINYTISENQLRVAFPHNFIQYLNSSDPIYNTLLITPNTVLSPLAIRPVNFQNIEASAYDYLIITHPRLQKAAGEHPDVVQAYADYRASEEGGGFSPLVMDINQLYDQYNYGEKSPLAIRRFADDMFMNGTPRFLLIIGKSISLPDRNFKPGDSYFLDIRKNFEHSQEDLVPSAGYPPSDNHLVRSLGFTGGVTPSIPIGRIPAFTPEQVLHYLDKVIEHEANPPSAWQRNVLHLSGGNNQSEINQFSNNLNFFKSIATPSPWGAKVVSYQKASPTSNNPLNIATELNNGLGLITFFGHGSLFGIDLNIGLPSTDGLGYRNQGKYPLMLMAGCEVGAVFYNIRAFTDDWLFTPERGSIGLVAHSTLGYSGPLLSYLRRFYTQLNKPEQINLSYGEIIKKSIALMGSNPNFQDEFTSEQMILLGDPALRIFKSNLSDYTVLADSLYIVDDEDLMFNPESDSVRISWVVRNEGVLDMQAQTFNIEVKHIYPSDGYSNEYSFAQTSIDIQDTLVFTLPIDKTQNLDGTHQFIVKIDADEQVDEYNEQNNTTSRQVEISLVTAIDPNIIIPKLKVFPNPNPGILYIEHEGINQFTWELINPQGQRLKAGEIKNTQDSLLDFIDISGFSSGIYLVNFILPSQKSITYRIVLK